METCVYQTGRSAWRRFAVAVAVMAAGTVPNLQAVILYGTGDPSANTTAPTGALLNSGWQYDNSFLGFNGYPISPDSFVVSKHIVGGYHVNGAGGALFTYLGVGYTTVGRIDEPNGGDLTVLKIDPTAAPGPFPSFVPLYRKNDEVGKNFVVLGRGVERGPEVNILPNPTTASSPNGTLRGWEWGGNSGTLRWGENKVDFIATASDQNSSSEFLFASFTPPTLGGLPYEATLAVGDSSGGVFIQDTDGLWKLAGLNTAVDASFSRTSGGSAVTMALIDAGGLFDGTNLLPDTTGLDLAYDGSFQLFTPVGPVVDLNPLSHLVGSFHTRISNLTPWLDAVTVPESTVAPGLIGMGLALGMRWIIRGRRRRPTTPVVWCE